MAASRLQPTLQITPRAPCGFGHSLLNSSLGWPEWQAPSVQRVSWAQTLPNLDNLLSHTSLSDQSLGYLPHLICYHSHLPSFRSGHAGSCESRTRQRMRPFQGFCTCSSQAGMVLSLVKWLFPSLYLVLCLNTTPSQKSSLTTFIK